MRSTTQEKNSSPITLEFQPEYKQQPDQDAQETVVIGAVRNYSQYIPTGVTNYAIVGCTPYGRNAMILGGLLNSLGDIFSSSSVVLDVPAQPANVKQKKLLNAEGGYLMAAQVANLLNCLPSVIEQMRSAGELIGILTTGGYVYPAWQVANGKLLDGLSEVLRILKNHDHWMKLSFMLSSVSRLGESPLHALRHGRICDVEQVARTYGEQGAV